MDVHIDELRRRGFGVMRGVIPPEEVDFLRESIAATVRLHTINPMPQGYVGGLLRVNQEIAPHLAHPRISALCQAVFGPHARISAVTGTVNGPGVMGGAFHVDWPHNQRDQSSIRTPFGEVLAHLVTFWMLTDFTAQNGGTLVIPGSHKWPPAASMSEEQLRATSHDAVNLLGSAGDVGLLDARTWHAIAPNFSPDDRVAVIVRIAPWWLNLRPLRVGSSDRQLIVEDQGGKDPYVATLPIAHFKRLPVSVQPLVGAMVEDEGAEELGPISVSNVTS